MSSEQERWSRIIAEILKHEGGYVNHVSDNGGPTKFGITQRTYPDLDIENLTREQAAEIYRRDWYLPLRCDQIADERVALKLLDVAVNMGASRAVRMFQQALIERGHAIQATGRINDATIAAANKANPEKLLEVFRRRQADRYRAIIAADPSQVVFERGWMNRVNAC